MSRFNNVPVEADTEILFEQEAKFGDYDVLYQKWVYDGITAESIIFSNDDVLKLSDEKIKAEVKESPLIKDGSSITLKRSDSGFTFVNFNFET